MMFFWVFCKYLMTKAVQTGLDCSPMSDNQLVDRSRPVQSSTLKFQNIFGLVPVQVHSFLGQKTGLDWTFEHYERWDEELKIVKHEMCWTILWFKHQEHVWERRFVEHVEPGLQAYAAKQRHIWERFKKNAEDSFGKYIMVQGFRYLCFYITYRRTSVGRDRPNYIYIHD